MTRGDVAFARCNPAIRKMASLTGCPALKPVRVHIGMNLAPDVAARADLALAALIRSGAFSRKLRVITTPTGTGLDHRAGQCAAVRACALGRDADCLSALCQRSGDIL